jgi:hypothetical protein
MAHRPPIWQQNANGKGGFEQSTPKRQRFAYESWEACVDIAGDSHSAMYLTSSDGVSTSALRPGNVYFPISGEQIERKDNFLGQSFPIDGSLGASWYTSNQCASLQQPAPDISTSAATYWVPTHSIPTSFVSANDQPTICNTEQANLPFRQGLSNISIKSTTNDQVCFGMASYHQFITSSTEPG